MSIISIQKFSEFIIKALPKVNNNSTLASFAFTPGEHSGINNYSTLVKGFEKSFYWEKPAEKTAFLALGGLISVAEDGKNRFAAAEKKIRSVQNSLISNWDEFEVQDIPLFVGAMKFSPENDRELWENYADSDWFVPNMLLYKKENFELIIYNFLVSPGVSSEKLISEFEFKTNHLLKNGTRPADADGKPKAELVAGHLHKDKKKWTGAINKAVELIQGESIDKIVLSRKIELSLKSEADIMGLMNSLRDKYKDCYLFVFHSGKSHFIGASPEKLARLTAGWIETDALAGSIKRGETESDDAELQQKLLESSKDMQEHELVRDYIVKQFADFSEEIIFEKSPAVKKLNNIQHLWTPVRARLKNTSKPLLILESLHPTPAVCGTPKTEALNLIKKLEDYPRGLYAGLIGWFNFNGEGEFSVAIRSALLKNKKLYAFAGCGIVSGSEPSAEYKETELKFKPILSLFELNEEN